MLGGKASALKWERVSRQKSGTELPWLEVLRSGKPVIGAQFNLNADQGETVKFAINASPILSPEGKPQGVLITLDDITEIEEQNVQLQTMVQRLEKNEAQLQERNKELEKAIGIHHFSERGFSIYDAFSHVNRIPNGPRPGFPEEPIDTAES